jgi:hypothetical protein
MNRRILREALVMAKVGPIVVISGKRYFFANARTTLVFPESVAPPIQTTCERRSRRSASICFGLFEIDKL